MWNPKESKAEKKATIFICLYGVLSLYSTEAQDITIGVTLPFGLGLNSTTISSEYYAQAAYQALEAVNKNTSLLAGKTLKLLLNSTDCTSEKTLEAFTYQWKTADVHGFIGTGCACETSAKLAGIFNLAFISQICTDNTLSNKAKYPTFARTIPANSKLAVPVLELMKHYNWTLAGLVVQDTQDWIQRGNEIKSVLNHNGITVTIMRETPTVLNYNNNASRMYLEKVIKDVQETSRVIILAMEYSLAREALYYASKLSGNQISDFAFIMFALDPTTLWTNLASPNLWLKGKFPGESENVTESLKEAFDSTLLIAMNPLKTSVYETFVNSVKTKTKDPPISSNVYEGSGSSQEPPILAAYLYDAVMQLASAFTQTLSASKSLKDGKSVISSTIEGQSYQSILGYKRYIDSKGDSNFDLVLMDFDSTILPGNFTEIGKYERNGAGSEVLKMFRSAKWPGNQGPPKDKPKCGFYGESCRKNKNITIGLLTPFQLAFGYGDLFAAGKYFASGITVALEKINSDPNLLPDHHINFIWAETRCNEETSIRMMATFIEKRVDAVLGFACKCTTQARVAASLNIPVISHMCTNDDVSNKKLYPTFARTIPADGAIGPSIVAMLDYFKWNLVSILSEKGKTWTKRGQFIEDYLKQKGKKISIHENVPSQLSYLPKLHLEELKKTLQLMAAQSRVFILAMNYRMAREVIYAASQLGMYTGEYAFIVFELSVNQVDLKIKDSSKWFNGRFKHTANSTDSFKHMFQSVLVLAVNVRGSATYEKFNYQLKTKASQAPFYSTVYEGNVTLPWGETRRRFDTPAPIYGAYLYDAAKVYAMAVNRTLAAGQDYKNNGKEVVKRLLGRKYDSITGTDIYMNKEGDIEYNMTLYDYRSNGSRMVNVGMFHITEGLNTSQVFILYPNTTVQWYGGKGAPRDVPACGFKGELCIDNKFKLSIIEIACIVLASLVVLLLIVGGIIYRKQKIERELASELWRINFREVIIRNKRQGGSCRSQVSVMSNESFDNINQRQLFTTVGMLKSHTVAIKKINKSSIELTRDVRMELNLIRNTRHENLTPFIGACVDSPNICIIELYCPKGSLQDILENEDVKLDSMFISSLMTDIVKGMIFLHSTEIKSHGRLKSSNCVVDGRWVLKISDYGLTKFKANQKEREDLGEYARFYQKLWTAPELLRIVKNPPPQGTQKGDVYSFSIILQEMLTRSGPFDLSYYHTEPKEIIQKVSIHENPVYRPKLSNVLDSVNLPGMKELAEKCWNENPDARPDFEEIRKQVRKHSVGKTTNIMDNMVNMLEKYANNLESLVEERTGQLAEEKRKTDNLLHRMLPPTVARDLIQGKQIKAENFDEVSIFFSDIVGFTSLSSESTPFQIVDLLNDLYTLFDDIINNYDVYKVETIGDAYMVVSGLPIRNGRRHAGEIASMALHMLTEIGSFKVRHRPDYKLKLRIGIHSGSACACVVGIKMPRYCLFGDTVNTASRMESNGEALRIHISPATKQVLDSLGGYHIEERGEVFLKGKGTWLTYWLIGSSIAPRKSGKPQVVKETKQKDEPIKVQRRNSHWDVVKNLLPKIAKSGKKNGALPPLKTIIDNGHLPPPQAQQLPPINI